MPVSRPSASLGPRPGLSPHPPRGPLEMPHRKQETPGNALTIVIQRNTSRCVPQSRQPKKLSTPPSSSSNQARPLRKCGAQLPVSPLSPSLTSRVTSSSSGETWTSKRERGRHQKAKEASAIKTRQQLNNHGRTDSRCFHHFTFSGTNNHTIAPSHQEQRLTSDILPPSLQKGLPTFGSSLCSFSFSNLSSPRDSVISTFFHPTTTIAPIRCAHQLIDQPTNRPPFLPQPA